MNTSSTLNASSLNVSTGPWIWAAIILQGLGYLIDLAWHGVLNPGREPATVAEMVRHLATVHLVLYVGALLVLVTTAWALVRHVRQSTCSSGPSVALAGAALSAGAEAGHAAEHLHLDTHTAPVAGMLSGVGFVIVIAAMVLAGRHRKQPMASSALRP